MTLQEFIAATTPIPIADLTTFAAQRATFGDDVLAAFATQVQLRSTAAATVLETATAAQRDTLLASEQRSYDGHIRERDAILGLQRAVERRTEERAFVPATQTTTTTTETAEVSGPVLNREQRCLDYVRRRGGAQYAGDAGADTLRFGTIVRAMALGDRRGLSALEQRVLSEGTDASGGFSVPEFLAATFIDRVRNNMVTMKAGASTVPMPSEIYHLARLAQPGATPAPAWKVENNPIVESGLVLERVTFTARTLPILITLSVELSEDSTNIDAIIEREMSAAMALELDRAALLGSGVAPIPAGVKHQPNIHTAALVTPPVSWDFLVDASEALWASNIEPNAVIWGSAFAASLAKLKDTMGQPLEAPEALSGITQYRTNQVSADVILGDFSQLMMGLRTSFRLEASRVAAPAFQNLSIAVRAYLRADVQLAHPEAFNVLS